MNNENYTQSAAYPSGGDSRKMAWRNLLFPFINKSFGAFFAAIYLLETWLIGVGANTLGGGSFLQELATFSLNSPSYLFSSYGAFLFGNPGSCLLLVAVFAGLFAFADTKRKGNAMSWIFGGIHSLLQVLSILLVVWIASKLVLDIWSLNLSGIAAVGLLALLVSVGGWLVSGLVMGVYLLAAILLLKTHDTEAFSSLRGEDYKNFIRLCVGPDEVRIFPIKIPRASRRWKYNAGVEGESPWYEPAEELEYGLIEDPIVIRNS